MQEMDEGARLEELRWDYDRRRRRGFSESVLCQGKTDEQILAIAAQLEREHPVVFTRMRPKTAELLKDTYGDQPLIYEKMARTLVWGCIPSSDPRCAVAVLTGGTADIPVAKEAEITLHADGIATRPFYDVGVAGLYRLLDVWPGVATADVIIVVAGMDGALPSVVAGLAHQPVIAVPTSVGYGAHLQGIASLLTMLNSCAEGIGVVNIDNGFGAARLAGQIVRLKWPNPESPCRDQGLKTRGEAFWGPSS